MTDQLAAIEHIVVLMLENRSFDHLLGLLYSAQGNVSAAGQPYEGLTGKETNPGPTGAEVAVFPIEPGTANTYFMPGADPGEGYQATNSQLFGSDTAPAPPVATNRGFVTNFAYTLGWETKEPGWAPLPGTQASDILGMYTPALLPVLSGLARGFAVCDHWYGSVPTETLPNRAFCAAGTSQGHMDDKTKKFTAPTIFGLLSKQSLDWRIYGYTSSPLTRLTFSDTTNAAAAHFGLFADFKAAAAAGALPPYTFLEPDFSASGNSQHPNYSVALGEQLIHDVYYALRQGPGWNQTLLIVTYDEHGGCYDHVAPPSAVAPDASVGEYGFDFKRFGPRVPTVLVSPLIAAGTVFRAPQGAAPFDHTSILKTVERRWSLPSLTARDAAAADVGAVLTLAAARTDDPLRGVTVPVAPAPSARATPPSHLERVHAELASRLPVPSSERSPDDARVYPEVPAFKTSADIKAYIDARVAAWAASRQPG
jgi:phospholipase C